LLALAGPGTARRMLLSGEALDAAASLRCGLVELVVEDSALDAAVRRLAEDLRANSVAATRAIKESLLAEEGLDDLPALADRMAWSMFSGDVARSAERFLARRSREAR
jgi:enoyl-CoA hydratase/carnithine racemase